MRTQLIFISNFRGFAMLSIVAVHCIYLIADSSPLQYKILDVLLTNSSMYFIFISGFLFQYLLSEYEYFPFLKKKLRYVVLPYLIMSAPAIVLILLKSDLINPGWIATETFQSKPVFFQVLLYYITGAHLSPFWFIPVICVFYIISPILYLIDKYPVLYSIIPVLLGISLIAGRPELNDNTLHSFIFFLPVYLLGMCTSRYIEIVESKIFRNWEHLLFLSICLTFCSFFVPEINILQKIMVTYLVMYLFYSLRINWIDRFFGLISRYSFSIFFLHKYILILIVYIGTKALWMNLLTQGTPSILFVMFLDITLTVGFIVPVRLLFKESSRILVGS